MNIQEGLKLKSKNRKDISPMESEESKISVAQNGKPSILSQKENSETSVTNDATLKRKVNFAAGVAPNSQMRRNSFAAEPEQNRRQLIKSSKSEQDIKEKARKDKFGKREKYQECLEFQESGGKIRMNPFSKQEWETSQSAKDQNQNCKTEKQYQVSSKTDKTPKINEKRSTNRDNEVNVGVHRKMDSKNKNARSSSQINGLPKHAGSSGVTEEKTRNGHWILKKNRGSHGGLKQLPTTIVAETRTENKPDNCSYVERSAIDYKEKNDPLSFEHPLSSSDNTQSTKKDKTILEFTQNGYDSPLKMNEEYFLNSEQNASKLRVSQYGDTRVLHNYEDLHKFISQEIETELNKNWISHGDNSTPNSPEDLILGDSADKIMLISPSSSTEKVGRTKTVLFGDMNLQKFTSQEIETEMNKNWFSREHASIWDSPEHMILDDSSDKMLISPSSSTEEIEQAKTVLFEDMIMDERRKKMIDEQLRMSEQNIEEHVPPVTRSVRFRESDETEYVTTRIRFYDHGEENGLAESINPPNGGDYASSLHKTKTTSEEKKPKRKRTVTIRENIPEEGEYRSPEDGDPNTAASCYFGVRSYLHQFYDPASSANDLGGQGERINVDNFEYLVDPSKSSRHQYCKSFLIRAGVWAGVNLVVVGIMALLFGYLTPENTVVVSRHESYEVIDQYAIIYNRRLELCRLAGLVVFCCGVGLLLVTFVAAMLCYKFCPLDNNNFCWGYDEPGDAERVTESCVPAEESRMIVSASERIPITEQIKPVQPSTPTAPDFSDDTQSR